MIDPCVLTEPCWLEEYLDTAGVADQDWFSYIPDEVIDVVQAMHRAGASDEDIAAHFVLARDIHVGTQLRNRGLLPDGWDEEFGPAPKVPYPEAPFPVHLMGGRWAFSAAAVKQVRDAPCRRERRPVTRPALIAKQRVPEGQADLFDLTEAS